MSRGTPTFLTHLTEGTEYLSSGAENDRERGGRLPTVRHEHLLWFIGKPYSNTQIHAEKERIEGCLVGIAGPLTPEAVTITGQELKFGERH